MRSLKTTLTGLLCSLSIGFFACLPTNAGEQVSFRVGGAERSVAVADLRKLVNTGEQSDVVSGLLGTARIEANVVRGYLGATIDIKQFDLDIVVIDKLLNSYLLELLLQDISKSVRSPGSDSTSGSIKSAIIASIADDSKISVIEFLEKFPTELIVEIDSLSRLQAKIANDFANLAEPLTKIVQRLQIRR